MALLQAEINSFSLWKQRKLIRRWKRVVLDQIAVHFRLLL